MSDDRSMEKEYITLDTNQHNSMLEEAIFDYADLAYNTHYKDVRLVFTPLLLMERTNFHIHPEQVLTKRELSQADQRLLQNRRRIRMTPFNEYDYSYMQILSDALKEHLTPEVQASIPPESVERVRQAAFAIKQVGALPQDPPYDTCPASAAEINPFDFDDLAVTAALYSVSGTRKFVYPYVKAEKFNSADYSMIAAFENHLSEVITPLEERQARTIFVSNDHMLQDELLRAARDAGDISKAELHNRDSLFEHIQTELGHILEHMKSQGMMLDEADQFSLDRLQATLAEWEKTRVPDPDIGEDHGSPPPPPRP